MRGRAEIMAGSGGSRQHSCVCVCVCVCGVCFNWCQLSGVCKNAERSLASVIFTVCSFTSCF